MRLAASIDAAYLDAVGRPGRSSGQTQTFCRLCE